MTNKQFVKDNFTNGETTLYKTGDLARWLPDGNIEYLGRIDNQVKIRGHRIELGEIEGVLDSSSFVTQCIILAKEDHTGLQRLVAFVVPDKAYSDEKAREYLQANLPNYMVPSLFMELEEIPLSTSGKVDRKALDRIEIKFKNNKKFTAASTELESKLVGIWESVLGREKIGVDDDFFDLGGHSLVAIRILTRIRKKFNTKIEMLDFFAEPTILGLAKKIGASEKLDTISILRQERPEFIPLSFSQEQIWFIDKLQGSIAYHMLDVLPLDGAIDKTHIENSFKAVINRHEILRTVFIEKNEKVFQKILEKDQWTLLQSDYTGRSEEEIKELIDKEVNTPFDLSVDHMLRARLVVLDGGKNLLVWVMHHIATDGWSMPIFRNEVLEFYHSNLENRTAQLADLEIQYADYALWQRSNLTQEVLNQKLDYWVNRLDGLEPINLPIDYLRPSRQSTKGRALKFRLGEELTGQLNVLAKNENATLFMLLMAIFKTLLYRYTGQLDICIGSPIANRTQSEVEPLIGYFVNTLALRTSIEDKASFKELLARVKSTTLEAYAHQDLPFEKIVDKIVKHRDLSQNPIYQIMLVLNKIDGIVGAGEDTPFSSILPNTRSVKFDLSLNILEFEDQLEIEIEYCTDLFKVSTIERIKAHLLNIMESVLEEPAMEIRKIKLLGSDEKNRLLYKFNDTKIFYGLDEKTIIQGFEEQVEKSPNATALIVNSESFTFQKLNSLSNELANYLILEKQVKPGQLVCLKVDRDAWMVISILAIMKCGAAYVPIDVSTPKEYSDHIIADCGMAFTLENDLIATFKDNLGKYSGYNPRVYSAGDDQFAILYTSGSTNKPKGVCYSNKMMLNRFSWMWERYPFHENEVACMKTSIGFADHIWELFGPLLKGIPVVVFDKNNLLETDQFIQALADHKVTRIVLVPSLLELMLSNPNISLLNQLKYWTCSGELLPQDLAKTFYQIFPSSKILLNIYGSTEVAADATCYDFQENGDIVSFENGIVPIGRPISNCSIYILDNNLQLLPVGTPGEIFIAGDGIGEGYFNNPQLNNERFIPDPFTSFKANMFKSGDLGYWLENGNIQYLGRKDRQVKVRGNRIELGAIEVVLRKVKEVEQVIVCTKNDALGKQQLVAYITTNSDFDKKEAKRYLKSILPTYMVPSVFVLIDKFPLTSSGKINTLKLPDPAVSDFSITEYVGPKNDIENRLVKIWEKVLKLEKIGVHDDFFELGGHSLLATRVASAIKVEFEINILVIAIFEYQNIVDLANYVQYLINDKVEDDQEGFVFKV